jgi:hypothetical protein
MRGKLLFIVGGLAGYVLGARAGRKRYDQIAAAANDFWNAKPVQRRVSEVRDFALEAVGDAPVALFKAGKKAVNSMQSKKTDASASAPRSGTATGAPPATPGSPASPSPARSGRADASK